jgi:molecular chaperone GrpE
MSKTGKPDQPADISKPSEEELTEALAPGNDNILPEEFLEDADPDPFVVLERLHVENEELKNQVLRLAADMENLRRRTDREKSEASKYANSAFARDIIAVADNIGRAIATVPEGERETNESLKNLLAGVEMTERELLSVFQRHGIERLEPEGAKFDPNFHDAVFEIENLDVPHGTVLEVAQSGYAIAGRVLRPAMVGVSKGGPKTAAVANGENDAEG